MYEEITHDTLLEDMQDEVIDDMNENADVDVNDGSLFYNSVSAAAYELERFIDSSTTCTLNWTRNRLTLTAWSYWQNNVI